MTSCTGGTSSALEAARAAGVDRARVNPALLSDAGRDGPPHGHRDGPSRPAPEAGAGSAPEAAPVPGPEQAELLVDFATAPALLTLTVTTDRGTVRRRVAVSARRTVVEESIPGGTTATWTDVAAAGLSAAVRGPLEPVPAFAADPLLTQEGRGSLLRLTADQALALRRGLESGETPLRAAERLDGLDPRLQDALLASGPRAAMSLTLFDPSHRLFERPVPWARVWVLGDLGLYRTDPTPEGLHAVLPVAPGDVLGTALPLLEEAGRFADLSDAAQRTRR